MKILVTGGTGFLGELLVSKLEDVRVVARNEGKLIALKEKYPHIEIMTGDIADPWVAKKAMLGVQGVYHLAAFKHVGLAESDVFQCVSSNVQGSWNILNESLQTKPEFVIGISTDKAAQVSGVYGATKLLMERLFEETERLNPETKYRIVRYGNVLYSTGSVLTKWREKIVKNEEITVTDTDATRFFWTREQALSLIDECLAKAPNAKPWVPEMKAMKIGELLRAMVLEYNLDYDLTKIKVIGLQPGENMHETMDGKVFSNDVEMYTLEEIRELV